MVIQKILRTFLSTLERDARRVTLDDEIALYRFRAEKAVAEERYADALVFLAKVLRLDPGHVEARLLVAEIYHHGLGERTKALVTYEKVIAAAHHDETHPCAVRARQGIALLITPLEGVTAPRNSREDAESPKTDNGGRAQSVAG